MTKTTNTQYVITANDLYNGEVEFWESPDAWSYLLSDSYVFDDRDDANDNLGRRVRIKLLAHI